MMPRHFGIRRQYARADRLTRFGYTALTLFVLAFAAGVVAYGWWPS